MKNKYLKGGLFTGKKARALEPRKSIYQNLEPEQLMQIHFFNWLKAYENRFEILKLVFAIPNGGYRHETTAKLLKAGGVRAGVWDIFIFAPSADGRFSSAIIEHKTDTGKLSDPQKDFENRVITFCPTVMRAVSRQWFVSANIVIDYFDLPVQKLAERDAVKEFIKKEKSK